MNSTLPNKYLPYDSVCALCDKPMGEKEVLLQQLRVYGRPVCCAECLRSWKDECKGDTGGCMADCPACRRRNKRLADVKGAFRERHLQAAQQISKCAVELLEVMTLERHGVRDGDGYWSGCNPIDSIFQQLCMHMEELNRTYTPPDDDIQF